MLARKASATPQQSAASSLWRFVLPLCLCSLLVVSFRVPFLLFFSPCLTACFVRTLRTPPAREARCRSPPRRSCKLSCVWNAPQEIQGAGWTDGIMQRRKEGYHAWLRTDRSVNLDLSRALARFLSVLTDFFLAFLGPPFHVYRRWVTSRSWRRCSRRTPSTGASGPCTKTRPLATRWVGRGACGGASVLFLFNNPLSSFRWMGASHALRVVLLVLAHV